METIISSVWHALVSRCTGETQKRLLAQLTSELRTQLEQLPETEKDVTIPHSPSEEELPNIHFSWFAPFLRTLSEHDIRVVLSALTPDQIKGLKQTLLLSEEPVITSAFALPFLKKTLFETLCDTPPLPPAYLPKNSLNLLLELTPSEIHLLIDLLAMYDLAHEMRQIIDKAKIQQIYAALSKPQSTFLHTLIHQKESVTFKKMGLTTWKGDAEILHTLLLHRGINRLAKALYGTHPSLIWHLTHRLESKQGQQLSVLCTLLDHPSASHLLAEQVITLFSAIKNNNPPSSL